MSNWTPEVQGSSTPLIRPLEDNRKTRVKIMSEKFDIAVIGSGPGGFRAATRCAQKNASVAVIEKESIGGVCLNWGCIPSKTLLASAHTLLTAKNAINMGVDIGSAIANWTKIQTRKDDIIVALRKGMAASMKAAGAKMIQGSAIATSPGKIKIQSNGTTTEIQTDKIIIATGSKPIEIPTIPFDGQTVISSKEALNLLKGIERVDSICDPRHVRTMKAVSF